MLYFTNFTEGLSFRITTSGYDDVVFYNSILLIVYLTESTVVLTIKVVSYVVFYNCY